jgi:hypothetical protein
MLELPEITLSHVLKFFHTLYAQAYQQNVLQRGLVIGGNAETHDCCMYNKKCTSVPDTNTYKTMTCQKVLLFTKREDRPLISHVLVQKPNRREL